MKENFEPGDQLDDYDIICPHCGHARTAEVSDGDGSEAPVEETCGKCGKEFIRCA
jgi:predicted RNA-binding Zn-ribbon protein involved in translation (DUF1610 family)